MSAEGRVVAAVDLGSNSFHLIVARLCEGDLRVLDQHRETVRLADGLDGNNMLSAEARARALECLERFGQRLRELDSQDVRAVGTNTFRAADNAGEFLEQAEQALGHPIDIISGVEEARLIYNGVVRSLAADDERRLVVDIGGGSTELILGQGERALQMDSLYMGCVSMSRRFFANGNITEKRLLRAEMAARQELEPVEYLYRSGAFDRALGSSGTAKAVAKIGFENGWGDEGEVTRQALKQVRKAMLRAGSIQALKLKGLSESRQAVLPGGYAVLQAVFSALEIDSMSIVSGALREGLIHDLVGRIRHMDVRDHSVEMLARRCAVDEVQADRVRLVSLHLYDQVMDAWKLSGEEKRQMLSWAAQLHECGRMVSYNQYHKHGEYIIRNANLHGFTQQEQLVLAVLVRAHRRKFPTGVIETLPQRWYRDALRLAILLRSAITLARGRTDLPLSGISAKAARDSLAISMGEEWLEAHPLTHADFKSEAAYLETIGYSLTIA